jgi:hypothetical protein
MGDTEGYGVVDGVYMTVGWALDSIKQSKEARSVRSDDDRNTLGVPRDNTDAADSIREM